MSSVAGALKRWLVDIYWTLRGPGICVSPIPRNPRSLLFVCKGNICRSPFAEHLVSKLQREGTIASMKVGSAGLHVSKPIASPDDAVQAALRFGVNLESHRSQSISLELVEAYDMVIAMEAWQYAVLRSSYQHHHEKLFLLPLLDSTEQAQHRGYAAFNIQDPYGCPPSAFDRCFERISRCIEGAFKVTGR
jgi:protein-tyrosine phosphatase